MRSRDAVGGGRGRIGRGPGAWLVAGLAFVLGGPVPGDSSASEPHAHAPVPLLSPPPRGAAPATREEIRPGGVAGLDSPAAGEDAPVVHDPSRHRVLLYGGKGDDDVVRNELWSFEIEARRWRRILPEGRQPPPREDHTLVLDEGNDQFVLFGGEVMAALDARDEREFPVNRVWSLDLSSGVWEDRTPYPRPMHDHVGLFVPDLRGTLIYGESSHWPGKEHATWLLRLR